MMMTAAGTVPAAKIFIMGVGVAGLQAIATARRLGGVVTATDVRPATKEQVESLGAKFLAVEDEEFKQAQTAGGYAKEMSKDYKAKQAALTATAYRQAGHRRHHGADSRPSGAAADHGGDGRLDASRLGHRRSRGRARRQLRPVASPDEVVTTENDVKIVGHLNVAGRLAATASQLYAKNLFAFLETLIDKDSEVARRSIRRTNWSRRRC